jgi:uncharacterized protein
MTFEFDPFKSATNKDKHGIDFVEAQALWSDGRRLELPARLTGEPRMYVVGRIGTKHWVAVWTQRGDKVRLISVRRARREEVADYEGRKDDHD